MVSIIVPVFNGEKYIKKCINSIINQTYKDIEVIIVNDGSTDNTIEIVKKIKDKRIKLINQSNKGVSTARNEGLKLAKGKYLLFFDADDFMEKDMIETLVDDIEKNNVQAVKCNLYVFFPKDKSKFTCKESIFSGENRIITNEEMLNKVISAEVMAFSHNIMFKKTTEQIRYNENIFYMEDVIFYITILKNIKSIYIENKPLYYYVQSEDSVTRSPTKIVRNINSLKLYNIEAKKELNKTGFYTEERAKMIDTRCTMAISNLLSEIKYGKNVKRKEAIKIFKNIFEDDANLKIINNAEKKKIASYKLITIYLGIKRKYNLLYLYNKFRKLCSKLKNILK